MRFSTLVLALPLATAHLRRHILDARDSVKHTFHFLVDKNNPPASVKELMRSETSDLSALRKIEAEKIPYSHLEEIISDDEADQIITALKKDQLQTPPSVESQLMTPREAEGPTIELTNNRLEQTEGPEAAASGEMDDDNVSAQNAVTSEDLISNETVEESVPPMPPVPVRTPVVADDIAVGGPQATTTPTLTQAEAAAAADSMATASPRESSTQATQDATAVVAESTRTAKPGAAGAEAQSHASDQTANAKLSPFQKYTLLVHNAVRGPYGVGELEWDAALAHNATAWASDCVYKHSPQDMFGGGQNIAYQTDAQTDLQGMTESFDGWFYKEEPNWNYATHAAQPTVENPYPVVGHFTAIVNGAFDAVGCGFVRCRKPMGEFAEWGYSVCNFRVRNGADPSSQFPQRPKSSLPALAKPPQ